MQQEGIFFIFLVFFILPIAVFFTNHDMFFIIMSIILFVTSIRSIHTRIFKSKKNPDSGEREIIEQEMEESINLDIKKLSTGTKVARSMFVILFFTYSSFFVPSILIKALFSLEILYWSYKIVENLTKNKNNPFIIKNKALKGFLEFSSGVLTVILIAIAIYSKFIS